MTTVSIEPVSGTGSDAIRTALAALLAENRKAIDTESRVLVVPDTHYPHHPSTGLVTNPAVVEELVDLLDADVAIGIAPSEHVDAGRVGQFLGYEGVADRTGAELVDVGAADRVERRVSFVDGSVSLDVPEPLLDDAVVLVPTLRQSPRRGVAAGMTTLARAITEDPTREQVVAATRVCWPDLSILDGTVAYAGEPRRKDVLLASDDVVAATGAAVDLLEVDRSDVPHLVPRRSPPSPFGSVGSSENDEGSPDGDDLMSKGYRFYARLTGDLVPPQMLARGDQE